MSTVFNHGTRVIDASTSSRPLEIADVSTIGLNFIDETADDDFFPPDSEPRLFYSHEVEKVAALGTGLGNTARQMVNAAKAQGIDVCIVASRVAHSTNADPVAKAQEEMANLVGSAASLTGAHALSYAEGHVGRSVDILVGGAPSAGRIENAKNPYGDALQQVGNKLKAVFCLDTGGPDSDASLAYRADFSNRYGYLVALIRTTLTNCQSVSSDVVRLPQRMVPLAEYEPPTPWMTRAGMNVAMPFSLRRFASWSISPSK